jgi:hypothetical protein
MITYLYHYTYINPRGDTKKETVISTLSIDKYQTVLSDHLNNNGSSLVELVFKAELI